MSIFSWKVSEEDLKKQVENYNTLKLTESYRGIAALLVLGSMILTVLLAKFGVIDYSAVYSPIIYLPIAFFIYKGQKWAMITIMILWTLEKGYQLYISGGSSPIVTIIWWFLFMVYFYNAFKVELARRKLTSAK